MELTLKAARKLEGKINSFLKEETIKSTSKVRVTVSAEEALQQVAVDQLSFKDAYNKRISLLYAISEIRSKISAKNKEAGIDNALTEKVNQERILSEVNALLSNEATPSKEVLTDVLELAKSTMSQERSSYSLRSENPLYTQVSILGQETLDDLKKQKESLKANVEGIEEQLQTLNYTTKITLSESSVKLLKESNLLR